MGGLGKVLSDAYHASESFMTGQPIKRVPVVSDFVVDADAGQRSRLICLGRTIEKRRLADNEQPIASSEDVPSSRAVNGNTIEDRNTEHQILDGLDLQAGADGRIWEDGRPALAAARPGDCGLSGR
jgi:hypothetical protein